MNFKKFFFLLLLTNYTILMFSVDRGERDILIEAKGSLFVPTNHTFREIYGNCGDFGLELTGKLCKQLYAFTSADFIARHGSTQELVSSTKINLLNLALGVKYFVPFGHGDFYVGLGIQPTSIQIRNELPSVTEEYAWVCGGVAKSGVIFDIAQSFFVDLFFDYSFTKADFYQGSPVYMNTTHLDGCVFGIGFGYRFN
ncbi:MAG: hypothetical protein ACXWL5_02320 [Candidatus Chromulinivorax sp.]